MEDAVAKSQGFKKRKMTDVVYLKKIREKEKRKKKELV